MKEKSKKYELSDLGDYLKLVSENRITVAEVCYRLKISKSTYYKRSRKLAEQGGSNEKVRIPRYPGDLRTYVELVADNRISVAEVCRRLNIKMSTYYRKSRELTMTNIKEESEDRRFIELS